MLKSKNFRKFNKMPLADKMNYLAVQEKKISISRSNSSNGRKVNDKIIPISSNLKGIIKGNFSLIQPLFQTRIPEILLESVPKFIECVVISHNSYIKNLGISFGTKYWKSIVLYCTLLIEGRPVEPVDRLSLGKSDKWPNKLGALRPLFHFIINENNKKEERADCLRLLQTLFKLNKVCSDFSELDISNIKETHVVPSEIVQEFEHYLKDHFPRTTQQRKESREALKVEEFVFGPSNGPNGVQKLQSAANEAKLILHGTLSEAFKGFCELTGNQSLIEYMENFSSDVNIDTEKLNDKIRKDIILRKLTSIGDSGNKSRVIAICDFWTQTLLNPLEQREIKFMSENFGDKSAFFSHSIGWQQCQSKMDETWLSIDATAWTDNFPALLQYIYLKHMYGQKLAKFWLDLAVKCDWYLGSSDVTVKYGKGQGMGTKGSFVLASVVDHIFIEYVYRKRYGKVLGYMKVGDDLVASDPGNHLIEAYKTIGVPINLHKSKIKTNVGHFSEFVSRNGWDGIDISIVSAKLLNKTRKQPFLIPCLLKHLEERGLTDNGTLSRIIEAIGLNDIEKVKLKTLIGVYEKLSGKPLNGEVLMEALFKASNEKFLLLEFVHLLLERFKTLEEDMRLTSNILESYDEKYLKSQYYKGDIISFYKDENFPLLFIQLYQFLGSLKNKVDQTLYNFMGCGTLKLDDSGLSKEEWAICHLLLEQILLLDSWIDDLKITNRLALFSEDNPTIFVVLFKELNKIVNKVNSESYKPKRLPNLLPGLFFLIPQINQAIGLVRDPEEKPVITNRTHI